MADISKEIQNFKTAVYGEEVRDSIISLVQKLNTEVEHNTDGVKTAIGNVNNSARNADNSAKNANIAAQDAANAAGEARKGKAEALSAASEAGRAAENANTVTAEVQRMLDAGELTGPPGIPGPPGKEGEKGEQGESGVIAISSGMFALELDPATGNLYAVYPDGEIPPQFEYDSVTGNLYYVIAE